MALEVSLLKTPNEISLSGNPIPFSFALSPYGVTEQAQDIRLQIRVLVEQIFNSGFFTEVKNQNFYPNAEGVISMEVQTILNPYLEFYTPRPGLQKPVQAFDQRKRFKISWILVKDGAVVVSPTDSEIYYVAKGGLSYEAWQPNDFFAKNILEEHLPLRFAGRNEKVGVEETRFLYWLYPYDDLTVHSLEYAVYFSDGSVVSKLIEGLSGGKWAVFCAPAGFNQAGLDALVPDGKIPIKYSIGVTSGENEVLSEYFYEIDHRNFYDATQILYRNSLGGLETVRLLGQIDFAAEYDRQMAQKTVPPSWYLNMNLMNQETDEGAEEQVNYTADTGFISKESCDKLRDLFLSPQKWEIKNSKLLPINIASKKAKFFSNKDSLISTTIEWQAAYTNAFYTPSDYMPATRTCPAVEKFIVKQISKNKLQIMFALQAPYSLIEVQIIIGVTTKTYTYPGNTRTVIQSFTNPATEDPVEITVKARTVCDENSSPVDYGPFTTLTLNVVGNSLPVANDDYYTIAAGYNTAVTLAPSALANDYDPDGDAIEVVAASGSTHAGGTFTINSAGIIQYTPPTSAFSGNDYFDYNIREVGGVTTVTARVHITVGEGASGVYAKIVNRNYNYTNAANYSHSEGEVWVDFFSNPAGTIPLDVSAMGLSINITDFYREKALGAAETTDDVDYTSAGSGTKILIYNGELTDWFMDIPTGDEAYRYHNFQIQPGTGYVVI